MQLSICTTTLFIATLLTGLSAGLCFTWTNAVTTGIAQLDDIHYLKAFQNMNRTIINPLFIVIFFGPILAMILSIYFCKSSDIRWILISTSILYTVGVAMVTMFGNVPLNEMLDQTNITELNSYNARSLRDQFEAKWNNLHLIRTITSAASLSLLIISCLLHGN